MMNPVPWLQMTNMISYQGLVRTFPKEDAIEVFKDWNISGDSAFSGQTEQPPSFASFLNTIKDKVKVTGSDKETD
ncbi:hypothetical protein [Klebsiella pneumoniae]|uniref:hypothetical protein n=1 Tax=Klebsiella pneumoniae TaxID=573 RepID=UPI00388EA13D